MLKLPKDWQTYSGEKLAEALLAQLPELPLRAEFSRNLIAASLDLVRDHRADSSDSCLLDLLVRYNRMIADAGNDNRLLVETPFARDHRAMKVPVPTYDPEGIVEYDFNRSHYVTIQEAGGLRAVMGDPNDRDSPDVFIERAVGLWRVCVHPNDGDPLCVIEIRSERATIETDEGELLLEQPLA